MTDNVVPLPLKVVPTAPCPEVVEALEAWLSRAKSGELQAFALATRTADGSFETHWASSTGHPDFTLVTGIARLQWRYQNEEFNEVASRSDTP